jgi:outer membrane protein OmpA-like peptidoglycan-associated protein
MEKIMSRKLLPSGPWRLVFGVDSHRLNKEGDKLLAVISAAAEQTGQSIRIRGFFAAGENDGFNLAQQRAKLVAGLLVNRHQIDSKRLFMSSNETAESSKVEVELIKNP